MPMIPTATTKKCLAWARARVAREDGFAMLVVLGVLTVATLLSVAAFIAVQGDVHLSQRDLDAKRAYYSARAGINSYLYQLNVNPNYWNTCANDTLGTTAVPGSTALETYAYAPIPANGNSTCTSDALSSLIDRSTGTLRLKFTGTAGNPAVTRSIVASFRKDSPLDYLWYTHYEALDSSISGYNTCNAFYRAGTRPANCNINWVTGDVVNGPMYTLDQYLILGSPTFGRNLNDKILSNAPAIGTPSWSSICANNSCTSATINGTPQAGAAYIPTPTDNTQLLTDATSHGQVFSGTTTINVSNNTATVTACPTTCNAPVAVNLTTSPIIYVTNAGSCTAAYSPFNLTYPAASGPCGDVYLQGTYNSSLTIAAANNIVINGNFTTTEDGTGAPTGTATAGLVANGFVRVQHGCSGGNNIGGQTLSNLKIDAAILALSHSFIVDNFDCGAALGNLKINGVIAQFYRGAVGTSGGGSTGYLKNYTYDDRLKVTLPPYLFDIAQSGWHLSRETGCVSGGGDPNTAC